MSDLLSTHKIGLIAGVIYAASTITGLVIGFLSVPFFVLGASPAEDPGDPLVYSVVIIGLGFVLGIVLAGMYLIKNGINNAVIISALAAASGSIIPVLGSLVTYPALVYLLGNGKQI